MNNKQKNTTEVDVDKEIETLKQEAVYLLDRMFGIPEGYSNGTTNRIVDCIISTSILEITSILKNVKIT